jgi:hypothetical protein
MNVCIASTSRVPGPFAPRASISPKVSSIARPPALGGGIVTRR